MKTLTKDLLTVKIMPTRAEMGEVAAKDIHDKILSLLSEKAEINMIFAAAPSQNDVLQSLIAYKDIEWNRINAYHMDEYIGLAEALKDRSFGTYLTDHIFGKVPFKSVNLIDSTATDSASECARYSGLLADNPTDIVVMGIGENGHIAFNDPWIAKFDDEEAVKVVPLDEVCRQQQVNDGCFASIDLVPTHAISLTCPTLAAGKALFCIVPAPTKAQAVKRTIEGEINEDCPATILRRHSSAVLYLDGDSSALL
jgi:glucosamine-6-phosphate deaminase